MRGIIKHNEQITAIRPDMLGGSDQGFTLRRGYETLTTWLCGLFLIALTASVQAGGIISTVAGQIGIGDGGQATNAMLNEPNGIAFDGSGNLYIADSSHNVIREVATNGVITTVAGNGVEGDSGDGGQATSAELDSPTGIAFDTAGNMYIADYNNNVIREVSGGNISTFAGTGTAGYTGDTGQATSAELNNPYSLAFDTAGNLYIADSGNNVIRVINNAGVINTYAGSSAGTAGYAGDGGLATSAELNQPYGVTVYAGNLYISDFGNNVIREVNVGTGDISTVAGSTAGTAGYTGDGGLATSAELNAPDGVAFDTAGNMYIADLGNDVIREVNAGTGDISTFAGTGSTGSSGDGGQATSAELDQPYAVAIYAGNLYIADLGNNLIREVNTGSGDISTVAGLRNLGDGLAATSAYLSDPSGTAFDAAGNLYIADYDNNRIREVNTNGVITTFAGTGSSGYSGDGGSATSAELAGPNSVAFDAAGNLYIADLNNNVIRMVNTNGVISTVAGNRTVGSSGDGGAATSAELDMTNGGGVAVFAGNLYIADYGNNRVRIVDSHGVIGTVAGNGTAGYSGDGGAATSAELDGPNSIAFDAAGGMYIADFVNNVIRKVNTSGVITTVAGDGTAGSSGDGGSATSAELDGPTGIAVDAAAQLYIAELGGNEIRMVSATGDISTFAGTGTAGSSGDGGQAISAELNGPYAVGFDTAGNLYIADSNNNLVRSVSANGIIPTAPTITSATGGSGQVTVKWTAPPGGATDYNIYQGTASGGESPTPIAVGITETNALITGLTNGKTYYFVITAANAVGTSANSNEVSATPKASPPAPTPPAGSPPPKHGGGGGGIINLLTLGLLMIGIAMHSLQTYRKREHS